MSEEILKALMQLFAIVAKQDDGATDAHRLFVESFLKFQLASERVGEYLCLYDSFLDDGKDKEASVEPSGEKREAKLTSVKDSVRTLGICKKINKTLSQKQKVVVLVRLLEMLKKGDQFTPQRLGIIDTVATVFNITKEELGLVRHFIINQDPYTSEMDGLLVADANEIPSHVTGQTTKHFYAEGLSGTITIIHVKSVDLYFAKYSGGNLLTINGLNFVANSVYLFAPGSNIRLPQGTLYFSDVVAAFMQHKHSGDLTFSAKNISYAFPNGKLGLRDITVSEPLGKLVAIMGASGAGKTTLLNVLSGLEKPSDGTIEINGISLINEPQQLEGIVGYIAQDDLLIEELTVYENLFFNARLCFSNLNKAELKDRVDRMLQSLGLFEAQDVKVGSPLDKKISGGQRKRLNIALELIREPVILFVDEPTSGLSSADSENVMDLLKELSIKGKLVFVVIHQPSSDIYKMFDKLILLDVGGYPAFYGNPIDAIIYLKKQTSQANAEAGECYACGSVNPELLFNLLESKVVDEYGQFLPERKIKPWEWANSFRKNITPNILKPGSKIPPKTFFIPGKIKQWLIFTLRDVKSKIANRQYLLINALEAPLLAVILAFVIKYTADPEKGSYMFRENENLPAYLFICIIVSLFIGLTVSAEEIYKDRKILKREKFLNLSKLSYLGSKIFILFFLSAFQSLLFVLIGNYVLEVKGMFIDYWLVLFSVSCFANILGLNISISFNSAVTIYILIPILVIPQMIFGGAMFSFDKINHTIGGNQSKSPLIADFFVSRWAYEALVVDQFMENKYEKVFYKLDKKLSQLNYKQAYYLPRIAEIITSTATLVKSGSSTDSAKTLIRKNSELITSELSAELSFFPNIENGILEEIKKGNMSIKSIAPLEALMDSINERYIREYNLVSREKDALITSLTDSQAKDAEFKKKSDEYTNEFLSDLVKKTSEKHKTKIQNNRIIQNLDPIFLSPSPSGKLDYRAHFYAPRKHFFGKYYTTFSFNLMAIWLMSILLFLSLYFELFNRLSRFISSVISNKYFR
jgi:ABC-type multidrug transport system ATPase subunit